MTNTTKTRTALFADTVARPIAGGWDLMNRQRGGFGASSRHFASLGAIVEAFDVRVGERGCDEHGPFVRILRNKAARA